MKEEENPNTLEPSLIREDAASIEHELLAKKLEKIFKTYKFTTFAEVSSPGDVIPYLAKEGIVSGALVDDKFLENKTFEYLKESYPKQVRAVDEYVPKDIHPSPAFFLTAPISSAEKGSSSSMNKLIAAEMERMAQKDSLPISNIIASGCNLCPQTEIPFLFAIFKKLENMPRKSFYDPMQHEPGEIKTIPFAYIVERTLRSILDEKDKYEQPSGRSLTHSPAFFNRIQEIIHNIKQITFSARVTEKGKSRRVAFGLFQALEIDEQTLEITVEPTTVIYDFFKNDKVLKNNYLLLNMVKSTVEALVLFYITSMSGYVPQNSDGRRIVTTATTPDAIVRRVWPNASLAQLKKTSSAYRSRRHSVMEAMDRLKAKNLITFDLTKVGKGTVYEKIVCFTGMREKEYIKLFGNKENKIEKPKPPTKGLDGSTSVLCYMLTHQTSGKLKREDKKAWAEKHLPKINQVVQVAYSRSMTASQAFNGVKTRTLDSLVRFAMVIKDSDTLDLIEKVRKEREQK